MTDKMLKKQAFEAADRLMGTFEGISDYVFKHPELGGEEFDSSKYLADELHSFGFAVTFPYEDLPTAFIASYGEYPDADTFAFVAEYDALPGKKEAQAMPVDITG